MPMPTAAAACILELDATVPALITPSTVAPVA